jgi:hypothetical protein
MESCLRSINNFTDSFPLKVLEIFNSDENIKSAQTVSRQFAVALAVTTVAFTLLSVSAGTFGILKALVAGLLGVVAYDFHIFSEMNASFLRKAVFNPISIVSNTNILEGQYFLQNTIVLLPIFNECVAALNKGSDSFPDE